MAKPNERPPTLVTIQRRALFCLIYHGQLFFDRDVVLERAWILNRALWVTCANCGYIHQFFGTAPTVEL